MLRNVVHQAVAKDEDFTDLGIRDLGYHAPAFGQDVEGFSR